MKKIKKRDVQNVLIMVILAIIRVVLGTKAGCFYSSAATYDDQLMAKYSMLYNHFYNPDAYSLVKTMVYPMFINLVYVLHIRYTIVISLIWVIDAYFVYHILNKITKNRLISMFFYIYTLFMYPAFDQWTGTRMYRNVLIAPFVLLTICLLLEQILNIKNGRISYKTIINTIIFGLIFTFTYYIKEDGMWLMACLLFTMVVNIGILIYRIKTQNERVKITKKELIKFLMIIIIPLAIFQVVTISYKAINKYYFGVYEIETKSGGSIGEFNNLIYKIKSPNRTSTVWAPYDAIEKAFDVSNTLKKYPELEENILHSIWCSGDIKSNPIKGDFLTWVLRESLIETGIWESEEQIDNLFDQVNREIKEAFERGELEKDNKIQIVSSAGGRSISEIKSLINYIKQGICCNINLDGYNLKKVGNSGNTDIETLESYRKKTKEKLAIDISQEELEKTSERYNKVMKIVLKTYSIVNIICFAIMIFIILLYIVKYFKNIKNIDKYINEEMFQLAVTIVLFGISIVYIMAIMWFAEFIMGAENEKRLITFYTVAVPSLMVFPYSLSINLIVENIKKVFNNKGENKNENSSIDTML